MTRLQSAALISERCLELQKPSAAGKKLAAAPAGPSGGGGPRANKAGGGKCAFLGAGSAAAATTKDMILAHPIDIEDLAQLGERGRRDLGSRRRMRGRWSLVSGRLHHRLGSPLACVLSVWVFYQPLDSCLYS